MLYHATPLFSSETNLWRLLLIRLHHHDKCNANDIFLFRVSKKNHVIFLIYVMIITDFLSVYFIIIIKITKKRFGYLNEIYLINTFNMRN